ncbi:unnamed protein product [Discosporangium mesarthrocarpum]
MESVAADAMSTTPLRWGIMGAGRVCHDYVQALKSIPDAAQVKAVGCRDLDRSVAFAELHGIRSRYGNYEDVAKDPDVEICYVGMLHPFHFENARMALNNGKHVLVEKPFTCTLSDTQELVRLAKEKGLFMMEGMWTRFFPAVEKAKKLVDDGELGDIVAVHSDFGFNGGDVAHYPDHPFYDHKLGGGGLFYVGAYPVAAAVQMFGSEEPTRVAVAGVKDELTGVDLSGAISLHYKGKGIASLTYNIQGETPEETIIIGTKGRIKLLSPSHCPLAIEVTSKAGGRGNSTTQRYDFNLPELPASVKAAGDFYYPNSNGFQYEAAAVHKAIRAGHTSCSEYPLEETIAVMKIMDEAMKQLGLESI